MDDSFSFDDLAPHEIDWLLRAEEADLPEHYSSARQNFLWRIGGSENAKLAIRFLKQVERVA